MNYVRVSFTPTEFQNIKERAKLKNKTVSSYVKNEVLKTKEKLHLYYLLNNIIQTIENMIEVIETKQYHTEDSDVVLQLASIEQILTEVINDNHS